MTTTTPAATGANAGNTRDRLLLVAAQLLEESGDRTLSTRAVCARAGVQAPSLYHHFGSKQGLIDAVVEHGFTQYTAPADDGEEVGPLDALRRGWDQHVAYGLEHPGFYTMLHGNVRPGRPCAITAPARAMLTALVERAAKLGLVVVPVADAVALIGAANVGATLGLIAGDADPSLSTELREATLAHITGGAADHEPLASRSAAAIALRTRLDDDPHGLSPGEVALLTELLTRLGGPD